MRYRLMLTGVALLLLSTTAMAAVSATTTGPDWQTIVGWLSAVVSTLVMGWAIRLERSISKAHTRIDDHSDTTRQHYEQLRARYDAKIAEALSKAAENLLQLSQFKLEQVERLSNYPTKPDMDRALERIGDAVERYNMKLDTVIQNQALRMAGGSST